MYIDTHFVFRGKTTTILLKITDTTIKIESSKQADIQDWCTPVLDDSKMMLALNKVHDIIVSDLFI